MNLFVCFQSSFCLENQRFFSGLCIISGKTVKTGSNGSEKSWGEVNGMNKSELINKVAETSELSKKDATKAVDAVFDAISEALQGGDKVQLVGFGNFEVRERSARKGRNPQTGDEIEIPASKIPAFKPGKALKDGIQ
jgi:DNA-binding protein HU-beta